MILKRLKNFFIRGNLVVKDLNDVLSKDKVKEKDFIYTENLTTVCVVVPK